MNEIVRCDCTIIGGGIIGLAIASRLARKGIIVVVVEAESMTLQHASSHNSEVIHSGIYYKPQSLKANLCVEGNELIYSYCKEKGVDYKKVGKLIIGNNQDDLIVLEKLFENGLSNDVKDLSLLNKKEIKDKEPNLKAKYAILSKTTGIIDSHDYALSLEAEIENNRGHIILGSPFLEGGFNGNFWELNIGGSSKCIINCDIVINSAGFNASNVAEKLGLKNPPQPIFVKGHYYKFLGNSPFNHLIYPIPDKYGLGIHTSLDMLNNLKFGPDAEVVDEPNYNFIENEQRRAQFIRSISSYFNEINSDLIKEDYCGVRVRLNEDHHLSDFQIKSSSDHGMNGLINLFGIESPGLTASLAIANEVLKKV